MEWKDLYEAVDRYVKLLTFPVAVKVLDGKAAVPGKRVDFEPDVAIVYGIPSQVTRCVQGGWIEVPGCQFQDLIPSSGILYRPECSPFPQKGKHRSCPSEPGWMPVVPEDRLLS
jgi:hypothetical protein